jgi:hypothetical protein
VRTERAEYIGKEGNLLERRVEGVGAATNVQAVYEDTEDFARFVVPTLRALSQREVASEAGITTRALRALLLEKAAPREQTLRALTRIAARVDRD